MVAAIPAGGCSLAGQHRFIELNPVSATILIAKRRIRWMLARRVPSKAGSREIGSRPAKTYVRFSNRPFGVKRFQTIHHCGVDVAHGLVLLFGIGTKALPSWDSKTGWNNL